MSTRHKFFHLSTSLYFKIWLVISFLFVLTVGIFGLTHPLWGDEIHFVKTIKLFGSSPWPGIFKDYPEVTTPLVYVIYAAWGKIFGFDLNTLRTFSLIISFSFLCVLYLFVRENIRNEKLTLIICAVIIVNPYIWGLSVFVFTDMLTVLFILLALYIFIRGNTGPAFLFLGLSLLCRQYAIIFILAVWIFILLKYKSDNAENKILKYTLYSFISFLPFILLLILWKGLSPPSGINKFIPHNDFIWKPHALVSYITFSAIYISPLIIIFAKKIFLNRGFIFSALILGCIYFVFPVEVSEVTRVQNHLETVGLIHKFLINLFGGGVLTGIILYLFFSIGILLIMIIIKDDTIAIKSKNYPHFLLYSLIFYIFLVVMPFSYQVWEKYLVLIIPVLALRFGLLVQNSRNSPQ